jgi:hypothetical protein
LHAAFSQRHGPVKIAILQAEGAERQPREEGFVQGAAGGFEAIGLKRVGVRKGRRRVSDPGIEDSGDLGKEVPIASQGDDLPALGAQRLHLFQEKALGRGIEFLSDPVDQVFEVSDPRLDRRGMKMPSGIHRPHVRIPGSLLGQKQGEELGVVGKPAQNADSVESGEKRDHVLSGE